MRAKIFAWLVTPSVLSGTLCVVTALATLLGLSWLYASQNNLFYDVLFGPTSITTAIVASPDIFGLFRHYMLSSPVTYYIVLLLIAGLVALLLYELLQGVGKLARQAATANQEDVQQAVGSLIIRVLSLVAWMVYLIVFMGVLVPFVQSNISGGLTMLDAHDDGGWLYILGSGALFTLGLHVHVIFARLTTQRLRIFSTSPDLQTQD